MEPKTEEQRTETGRLEAAQRQERDTTSYPSIRLYVLIGVVACLVIAGVVTYASTRSVPGDALYTFKTKVTEPALGFSALGEEARINHYTQLLETRLTELLVLSTDQSTSTPETLTRVTDLMHIHTRDALETLKTSAMGSEERIDKYTKLAFIAGAEKTLVESVPEFSAMTDSVTEVHNLARDTQRDEVRAFSSTSTPEVIAYLSSQIQLVSTEILSVAPGSSAKISATRRISDAEESIMQARLDEAITSILKAREAIAINQYLFDSERIPEDGTLPEVDQTEIPQGS